MCQIFTRDGVEKDARALSIEAYELERIKKDLQDQYQIVEDDAYDRIERLLTGKVAEGGPGELKAGEKDCKSYLQALPQRQVV